MPKNRISGEKLLSEIISTLIEHSEYEKLVSEIVKKAGVYFEADRCFFIEHDRSSTRNLPVKKYAEYLSGPDILSHTQRPTNDDTKNFVKDSKIKFISVVDNIDKINLPQETRKMLVDDLGVKSYVIMPVYYNDVVFGTLVLHYVKKYKKFKKNEIKLIKAIANNFASVIGQLKLHSKLKEQISIEKTILSNLPFSVWLKDINGRYIVANSFFMDYFGFSEEDFVGKKCEDVMPENIIKKQIETDNEVMKTKEIKHFEIILSNKHVPNWFEITVAPYYDESNNVIGTIGFSKNITEEKEIKKMEDEFVSTVSHELRTPLTSIKGSIAVLSSGLVTPSSTEYKNILTIANENCEKLSILINDLLDLNKIEAGKMDFYFKEIDIVPIIEKSILLNKPYSEKYKITMQFNSSIDSAKVNIDPERFGQVLTNLYSNAIKFTNNHSCVYVNLERINDKIRVSVTNHGVEISENLKNKIFEKFIQGDSSDTRKRGGTGLGLNISKVIIKKLGGEIHFISQDNQTTFFIDLPEIKS